MGLITSNPTINTNANIGAPLVLYLADGFAVFGCIGDPEGVITANKRSLALSDNGMVYYKTTDLDNTGWIDISGGGGGSIGGTIAITQVAVGTAANTIGGSSDLTFSAGGLSNLQVISGQCGFLANQAISDAVSYAYFYLQTPSAQSITRLTTAGFTPSGLVKANQLDIFADSATVEMLFRLGSGTARYVFGINDGEAMSVSSTTTENLVLGSPSTGAVPRDARIKFYNATNANYLQIHATAFGANRIWDLPTSSPIGTQALVGSLSGSTITLAWGSVSAALTATQIGFGDGSNVLSGSADFVYDTTDGQVLIVKTVNTNAGYSVNNDDVGATAQAQFSAQATTARIIMYATGSGWTTTNGIAANSSVIESSTFLVLQAGNTESIRQLIGSTECARLSSARLGLLSLGLGATPSSLDVLLERDAANALAMRNGASSQSFRLYNTYTDPSNYERLDINATTILFSKAGTGADRELTFRNSTDFGNVYSGAQHTFRAANNSTTWWNITTTGNLVAGTDNTYDIGASGATRPRNVFIAGTYVAGSGVNIAAQARIVTSADGIINITNNAGADFTRLTLGNATSSFPAIGRSGASIVIQLADGTLQTPILPINTNQLQFGGADAASPTAVALRAQSVVTGTSNTSGQNFTIRASVGTGNAVGGAIVFVVAPAGSSGTSQNSTINGMVVDGTGRIYGAAWHNNAAGMSGPTNQYVGSGTYTPTVTAVANCTAANAGTCSYLRVGNVVTVSGQVTIDPTSTATLTQVGVSLPIASTLASTNNCNGVAAVPLGDNHSAAIAGDVANARAEIQFTTVTDVASRVWSFTFTYEVI